MYMLYLTKFLVHPIIQEALPLLTFLDFIITFQILISSFNNIHGRIMQIGRSYENNRVLYKFTEVHIGTT